VFCFRFRGALLLFVLFLFPFDDLGGDRDVRRLPLRECKRDGRPRGLAVFMLLTVNVRQMIQTR